jgi:hypothetical protein
MSFTGLASVRMPDRRVLLTPNLSEGWHRTVISEATNVDAGSSPTTLLRPGNVLLRDAATGKHFDDADSGDASAPASVTALQTADANWASKSVEVYKNGALVTTVALGGADDTDAEVVAALNGNAPFRANFLASVDAARVKVQALEAGSHVAIKVVMPALAAAFSASGTEGRGTDGDYAVTVEYANQLTPLGTAADVKVHAVGRGHFDESNLIGLTADAKSVLLRRGSRFES